MTADGRDMLYIISYKEMGVNDLRGGAVVMTTLLTVTTIC